MQCSFKVLTKLQSSQKEPRVRAPPGSASRHSSDLWLLQVKRVGPLGPGPCHEAMFPGQAFEELWVSRSGGTSTEPSIPPVSMQVWPPGTRL